MELQGIRGQAWARDSARNGTGGDVVDLRDGKLRPTDATILKMRQFNSNCPMFEVLVGLQRKARGAFQNGENLRSFVQLFMEKNNARSGP
jgi:hypothetical protein